jgi:hypothetical protein
MAYAVVEDVGAQLGRVLPWPQRAIRTWCCSSVSWATSAPSSCRRQAPSLSETPVGEIGLRATCRREMRVRPTWQRNWSRLSAPAACPAVADSRRVRVQLADLQPSVLLLLRRDDVLHHLMEKPTFYEEHGSIGWE